MSKPELFSIQSEYTQDTDSCDDQSNGCQSLIIRTEDELVSVLKDFEKMVNGSEK